PGHAVASPADAAPDPAAATPELPFAVGAAESGSELREDPAAHAAPGQAPVDPDRPSRVLMDMCRGAPPPDDLRGVFGGVLRVPLATWTEDAVDEPPRVVDGIYFVALTGFRARYGARQRLE